MLFFKMTLAPLFAVFFILPDTWLFKLYSPKKFKWLNYSFLNISETCSWLLEKSLLDLVLSLGKSDNLKIPEKYGDGDMAGSRSEQDPEVVALVVSNGGCWVASSCSFPEPWPTAFTMFAPYFSIFFPSDSESSFSSYCFSETALAKVKNLPVVRSHENSVFISLV